MDKNTYGNFSTAFILVEKLQKLQPRHRKSAGDILVRYFRARKQISLAEPKIARYIEILLFKERKETIKKSSCDDEIKNFLLGTLVTSHNIFQRNLE